MFTSRAVIPLHVIYSICIDEREGRFSVPLMTKNKKTKARTVIKTVAPSRATDKAVAYGDAKLGKAGKEWRKAYDACDTVATVEKAKEAREEAKGKGVECRILAAGRPGSTLTTLTGGTIDGTFKGRMASNGQTISFYFKGGKQYKSRKHYEECKASMK